MPTPSLAHGSAPLSLFLVPSSLYVTGVALVLQTQAQEKCDFLDFSMIAFNNHRSFHVVAETSFQPISG